MALMRPCTITEYKIGQGHYRENIYINYAIHGHWVTGIHGHWVTDMKHL